jgi:hypothetical protein
MGNMPDIVLDPSSIDNRIFIYTDREGGASVSGVPTYREAQYMQQGDSFFHDAATGVEALLLALVAEGVTDRHALESAVDTALESISNDS